MKKHLKKKVFHASNVPAEEELIKHHEECNTGTKENDDSLETKFKDPEQCSLIENSKATVMKKFNKQ